MNRPGWVAPVTLWLAIAGLADSAWLTLAHYTTPTILACDRSGIINCERVTTSAQSSMLGIPVAVLGLLWFMAMAALCAPSAWRSASRALHVARVGAVVSGMAFVLWLVYAELYIVGAICLWCSAAHLLTFALFAIIMLFPDAAGYAWRPRQ